MRCVCVCVCVCVREVSGNWTRKYDGHIIRDGLKGYYNIIY